MDDLERVSKNLDIGELMGFINQYAESNNTRFLLILNLDELGEHSARWRAFREKVVNREIRLAPSADDAFDVVMSASDSEYAQPAREIVRKLRIDNIRVLQRIATLLKEVLEGHNNLPSEVTHRVVPSLVLLPAVFYRAVDGAPSMTALLKYDPMRHFVVKENKETVDPESQRAYELLSEVGIVETDPFEDEIGEALETGIVDRAKTDRLIASYLASAAKLAQAEQCDAIHFDYEFDAQKTPVMLLSDLRGLADQDILVDAVRATTMAAIAKSLGDSEVGTRIVDKWIGRYKEQSAAEDREGTDRSEARPSNLDARILVAIEEVRAHQRKRMTPIDAVLNIVRNSGWGSREREALGAARPEDYVETLARLSKDDLRTVFREHLVEFARRDNDEHSYFKVARAAFVQACRVIVARDPGTRIAWIVERRFQERGLIDELHTERQDPSNSDSGGGS